ALALEDNGEGSNATRPDRVTVPMLFNDYERSVDAGNVVFAPRRPCMVGPGSFLDWTNGNAQVR
ncbi:MAG TPA: hypothetical protein VFS57_04275, partial [Gemmatimonadaceae bacterium]|nr:hypothetical protein [Gemmatimonadaceae bacterium]